MNTVFDATVCALGEGPLWHPLREQLFWFDILGRRMLSRDAGGTRSRAFEEHVSAAGWVDEATMLVASQTALLTLDLDTGARHALVPLEADNPVTRSNDGRADPFGGFWIGTMGIEAEPGAGAIYRYYRGELRLLYPGITIPNAICFAPDGGSAVFCDTTEHVIRRVALDPAQGWPVGEPEVYIDMRGESWGPDGAVIDADGNFWNAQWGAGRVACYDPDGAFLKAIPIAARQTTCPAFGGPDLATLFVTSAVADLSDDERAERPDSGKTFAIETTARGQKEHKVIL